jgi:hypothetical protein
MVVERRLVRAGLGGELRRAGTDGGRGNGGSVCKQSIWACTWESTYQAPWPESLDLCKPLKSLVLSQSKHNPQSTTRIRSCQFYTPTASTFLA